MFAELRHFTQPEQFAMHAVLDLIAKEKIKITNFQFFSSIFSTPIVRITNPHEILHGRKEKKYARTHVTFFCRGERVARALVEGCVFETGDKDVVHMWRVVSVSGRLEYWRNDPEESKAWRTHEFNSGYSGTRFGSDEDERDFAELLHQRIIQSS